MRSGHRPIDRSGRGRSRRGLRTRRGRRGPARGSPHHRPRPPRTASRRARRHVSRACQSVGMPLRAAVEKRSAPVLVLLSRQHRAVVPLLSALLLLGGLALPAPIGLVCLLALAAFVGWLTYLSWPAIVGPARAIRVAVLPLALVAAATRLA